MAVWMGHIWAGVPEYAAFAEGVRFMRIRAYAISALSMLGLAACSQPAADDATVAGAPATASEAADALAPAGDLAAVAAGTWTASGTEPFWELKVAPGQPLDLTVEGASTGATGPYADPVMAADGSAVITTGNLVVTLSAGPCLAVGPTQYPYTATVSVDGNPEPAYKGCAQTPTEAPVAGDDPAGQPAAAEPK